MATSVSLLMGRASAHTHTQTRGASVRVWNVQGMKPAGEFTWKTLLDSKMNLKLKILGRNIRTCTTVQKAKRGICRDRNKITSVKGNMPHKTCDRKRALILPVRTLRHKVGGTCVGIRSREKTRGNGVEFSDTL